MTKNYFVNDIYFGLKMYQPELIEYLSNKLQINIIDVLKNLSKENILLNIDYKIIANGEINKNIIKTLKIHQMIELGGTKFINIIPYNISEFDIFVDNFPDCDFTKNNNLENILDKIFNDDKNYEKFNELYKNKNIHELFINYLTNNNLGLKYKFYLDSGDEPHNLDYDDLHLFNKNDILEVIFDDYCSEISEILGDGVKLFNGIYIYNFRSYSSDFHIEGIARDEYIVGNCIDINEITVNDLNYFGNDTNKKLKEPGKFYKIFIEHCP
jgi:hypothetical protein